MVITNLSFIGAFAMLVFGLLEYAMLQRFLYAPLRDRFERAKVTGTRRADPVLFWSAVKAMNFLVLPAVGFIFGEPILRSFIG